MKMVNANGSNSFLENYTNNTPKAVKSAKTYKEERVAAEEAAIAHEAGRKVQASKYVAATVSEETNPGFKTKITDHATIVEKAARVLKEGIGELVGKGGFEIEPQELRSIKAHNDRISDNVVTDEALMSFSCKFMTPKTGIYKTASFVVAYNLADHKMYRLENIFYTEANKETPLTKDNLDSYLKSENAEVKVTKGAKPLAYFNPEASGYDTMDTTESAEKVVARLESLGYNVDRNFYVDACYNTSKFGKLCYFVDVPMEKVAEFKQVASWSDDDWFNRTVEKKTAFPYKAQDLGWTDRTLDKNAPENSYMRDHKDYSNPKDWADRALQKEKLKNPYTGGGAYTESAKKEDVVKEVIAADKKVVEASKTPEASVLDKVAELENLLK